jgi:hypothetical protein
MKKRSKYRPRGVALDAWKIAMQGSMRLSVEDQLRASMPVRAAVERAAKSQQSKEDWRDIFDAMNLIEAMAHVGVIKDGAREFVEAHQETIVSIMDRHRATGSNVLRPAEVDMLRELSATWAQVLEVCTHRELFAAQERVVRKVRNALAQGSNGSVRVVEAFA